MYSSTRITQLKLESPISRYITAILGFQVSEYIKLNDLSFETEEQIAETFAIPDSMISDLNKAIQLTSMDSRTKYSSQLYNDGRFLF